MMAKKGQPNYSALYEEGLLHYNCTVKEKSAHRGAIDADDGKDEKAACRVLSAVVAARVGHLSTVPFALIGNDSNNDSNNETNNDNDNSGSTDAADAAALEHLRQMTLWEVDKDAATATASRVRSGAPIATTTNLMECILAAMIPDNTHNKHSDPTKSESKPKNTVLCLTNETSSTLSTAAAAAALEEVHVNSSGNGNVDVDADVFFYDYPECMRSDAETSESSSDQDESDSEKELCQTPYENPIQSHPPMQTLPQTLPPPPTTTASTTTASTTTPKPPSKNTGFPPMNSNGPISIRNPYATANDPPNNERNLAGDPPRNTHATDPSTHTGTTRTHDTYNLGGGGGDGPPMRNPYARQQTSSTSTIAIMPTTGNNHRGSMNQRQQQITQPNKPAATSTWEDPKSSSTSSTTNQNFAVRRPPPLTNRAAAATTTTWRDQTTNATTTTTLSSSSSSWETHQNNHQNPFQTAREFAQTVDGNQRTKDDDFHEDQQQQQSRNENSSGNSSHHRRAANNPYQSRGSSGEPMHEPQHNNNNSYSSREEPNNSRQQIRGSSIPNSLKRKFQPPKRNANERTGQGDTKKRGRSVSNNSGGTTARPSSSHSNCSDDEELPEELRGLDKELVEKIENEIIESGQVVTFDDIAGLKDAKQTVFELVIWPMKRPDLFTGLRQGPNGLLLFGPPGTGKTLIGKAIAHESGATFFSISSSSLTSKWIGEGEKLVRTLFAVAAYREPSVVFIDEIDSLLTQRKADENEASRRIKTEFLVQLDGTGTSGQGRVLVVGATNRPHELDDAARRRFVKRLYVPLPTRDDREVLLRTLLEKNKHSLLDRDIYKVSVDSGGFSGADLKALCTDAAMGPIRQLGPRALEIDPADVPPISCKHFKQALRGTKASVAKADLDVYLEWNKTYGSKSTKPDDDEDDDDDD